MACHMLVSLTEVVLLVAFEFKACSQNTHDRHLRKDCLKSLLGFCESLLVFSLQSVHDKSDQSCPDPCVSRL